MSRSTTTLAGCLGIGIIWLVGAAISLGSLALVIYIGALIVKSVMGW